MAEIDPVILELRADLGRYKAELRSTTTTVDQLLGRQEKSARRLEAEMKRSSGAIGNTIKGLAGTLAAAFTGRELVGLVDNFTRLQNALRVAGLEGENLARVQERLFALGAQYGVSVNALADLYGKAEQAGRELGASQSELIDLTTAVSQSILITGTSTEQASGAILGLTQALASGTVRAEEFNQINEGGLRPLLEAAAASERFGGSIAKLRNEVVEGTVSSEEFYRAILAGAEIVEGKASNATLTLSGAFQALSDQLAKYFGEAGQASGATAALAAAIGALADNLDLIIPALATIAAALGVRMVAGAIAGTNAMFALTAAMGGAATATEALAFAMNGLSRTIPLLAITAVVAALGYVAVEAYNAGEQVDRLGREAEEASARADTLEQRLRDAGVAIDVAGTAADSAKGKVQSLGNELLKTSENAATAAKNLLAFEAIRLRTDLGRVNREEEEIRARATQRRFTPIAYTPGGGGGVGQVQASGLTTEDRAALKRIEEQRNAIARQERALAAANQAGVDILSEPTGSGGTTSTTATTKPKPTPAQSGPTVEEIAFRQEQELARLRAEEIQAKIAVTTNAEERAELERDLLDLERNARIADVRANTDLTRDQQNAQIEIIENLYGVAASVDEQGNIIANGNRSLYAQAIERERIAQIEREQADLAEERGRNELEQLRLQYDLATTQDERRALALKLLETEDRILREKLQEVENSKVASAAEKERARILLEGLNSTAGARREVVERAEGGALDRYVRSLDDPKARVEEAVVRQLDRVNEGITDALSEALGVEDPFIKSLLDILLQEILFKPIAQAVQNAQGAEGGDLLSSLVSIGSSLFGGARAVGGPVNSRQAFLVGERGPELFVPPSAGNIIPNSRLYSGGGQGGTVKLIIEEAPGFAARVRTEAAGVAVEVVQASASSIVDAAAGETLRRANRRTL